MKKKKKTVDLNYGEYMPISLTRKRLISEQPIKTGEVPIIKKIDIIESDDFTQFYPL